MIYEIGEKQLLVVVVVVKKKKTWNGWWIEVKKGSDTCMFLRPCCLLCCCWTLPLLDSSAFTRVNSQSCQLGTSGDSYLSPFFLPAADLVVCALLLLTRQLPSPIFHLSRTLYHLSSSTYHDSYILISYQSACT